MSSLTNKMTKFYVGLVEDIIRDENNNPTADLRIRIPNLHLGLKTEELPIAKPMYVPGTKINRNLLIEQIDNIKRVYVIFEYGDTNKPRYIGVADFDNDYDITEDTDDTIEIPDIEIIDEDLSVGTYISELIADGHTITVTREALPEGIDTIIDIPLLEKNDPPPDTTKFRIYFEKYEQE